MSDDIGQPSQSLAQQAGVEAPSRHSVTSPLVWYQQQQFQLQQQHLQQQQPQPSQLQQQQQQQQTSQPPMWPVHPPAYSQQSWQQPSHEIDSSSVRPAREHSPTTQATQQQTPEQQMWPVHAAPAFSQQEAHTMQQQNPLLVHQNQPVFRQLALNYSGQPEQVQLYHQQLLWLHQQQMLQLQMQQQQQQQQQNLNEQTGRDTETTAKQEETTPQRNYFPSASPEIQSPRSHDQNIAAASQQIFQPQPSTNPQPIQQAYTVGQQYQLWPHTSQHQVQIRPQTQYVHQPIVQQQQPTVAQYRPQTPVQIQTRQTTPATAAPAQPVTQTKTDSWQQHQETLRKQQESIQKLTASPEKPPAVSEQPKPPNSPVKPAETTVAPTPTMPISLTGEPIQPFNMNQNQNRQEVSSKFPETQNKLNEPTPSRRIEQDYKSKDNIDENRFEQSNYKSDVHRQNFNNNPNLNPYFNTNQTQSANITPTLTPTMPAQYQSRFQSPGMDTRTSMPYQPMGQYRARSPVAYQQTVMAQQYDRQPTTNTTSMFQRPNYGQRAITGNVGVGYQGPLTRIFVKGLHPRSTTESIRQYLESIAHPAELSDGIMFSMDRTEALVTFVRKPDMPKMKYNVKMRRLDGALVDVCEVQPPSCLAVSSEYQVRSKETVANYFEKDSVGGPLVSNRVDETDDGCYIIEFTDPKTVDKVCANRRPHRVDGCTLRISPYYQCELGAMWDTSLHVTPIPKPVNIQILPFQLEFVKTHCQSQFSGRLRDAHASVTYTKDHVTLTCTLTPSMRNYRILVKNWETGAQETVARFLRDMVSQVEFCVTDVIWDKFFVWLNSGEIKTNSILVKNNRRRESLTLIGFPGTIQGIQHVINRKVTECTRALRRKTEKKKIESVEKLKILEIQGSLSAICRKFGDLKITTDGPHVTLDGDPDDLPKAFAEITKEIETIQPGVFKHSKTREFVQFLKSEKTRQYVQQKMDQRRIRGVWEINLTDITIYVPHGGHSENLNKLILNSAIEENIEICQESVALLSSEEWGSLILGIRTPIKDKLQVFNKSKQLLIVVVGSDDVMYSSTRKIKAFLEEKTVKNVHVPCEQVVSEFMSNCWTDDDFAELQNFDVTVKVKGNGVGISGISRNINKAKRKMEEKWRKMVCKKHTLRRTVVYDVLEDMRQAGTIGELEKATKTVVKIQKDEDDGTLAKSDLSDDEEDFVHSDHDSTDEDEAPTPGLFSTKYLKIRISLVHGEIGKQKGDVIVCSTSGKLNLRGGVASNSLLKCGGHQLQGECDKLYKDGIKDGDVAVIGCGKLKCRNIYLTSLPTWKDAEANGGKVLKDFMRKCLRLADQHSMKTIVFNAMGTGYLGYPRDVVASIMYGAVVDFDRSHRKTSIKEVSYCIFNKDRETREAFEAQERARRLGSIPAPPTDFVKGNITVKVISEDLVDQRTDAILVNVQTDMNLHTSPMCQALIKHGGKSLQDECKQRYNNSLEPGQVAEISGGKLGCRSVFLTALPTYSQPKEAELALIKVVEMALQQAHIKEYTSISIPALGTGYLNYPKSAVARCLFEGVIDWTNKNPASTLTLFNFLLHGKDAEAHQIFRSYQAKVQGREARSRRTFAGTGTHPTPKDSKYRMIRDGCMMGPITFTVSARDILMENTDAIVNGVGPNFELQGPTSQSLQKKCPKLKEECTDKCDQLKQDGVVVTGAECLGCDAILHVPIQDSLAAWKAKMAACLTEANKMAFKSIAFPVLGSGAGSKSFQPEVMSQTLFDAITDFLHGEPQPSVKDVRLVMLHKQAGLVQYVMTAIQNKVSATNSQLYRGKFFRPSRDTLPNAEVSYGLGPPRRIRSQQEKRDLMQQLFLVPVEIHSDSWVQVQNCFKLLDARLDLEYTKRELIIDVEALKCLPDSQIDNLIDGNILVDIRCDKRHGKFIISGPSKNTNAAQDAIYERLRVLNRERLNKQEAQILYNQIRWHYEESRATEVKEIAYTPLPNFVIERAYKDNRHKVEMVDSVGVTYIIDLNKLEEYPKHDKSDRVKVIRKDVLKGQQSATPGSWVPLGANENMKLVTLDAEDKEYTRVQEAFMEQVLNGRDSDTVTNKDGIQVAKIERVQNRLLFQQYAAKKKLIQHQKHNLPSNTPIERPLWHSVPASKVDSITNNGFNRSYCGVQEVRLGQGVYFAADVSHLLKSARPATPQQVFMVKVLTGEAMQGEPSIRVLPPVNANKPSLLYDSAVDDVASPMEFVIFHDTQAYPEYLVTFTG